MDNLDPNSSLQVEKLRNRKSRAVWQNNNTSTHNNPYANLSTGEKVGVAITLVVLMFLHMAAVMERRMLILGITTNQILVVIYYKFLEQEEEEI